METMKINAIAALLAATSATAAITAGTATAGGVDRSGQPIGILFEEGDRIEFSFASVNPDVSGTQLFPGGGVVGSNSGNMTNGYGYIGVGLKFALTPQVDLAFIYDQPFGADVAYPPAASTGYFAGGSSAELNSHAFTALGRYKFGQGFSVHGGLRYQNLDAMANVPFVGGYNGVARNDAGLGYVAGVAYERPEIALRVALTYNSKIRHDLPTTESAGGNPPVNSTTEVETPQSVNLDFQTGVAPGTLVFGGVRWVNWSDFEIDPVVYRNAAGSPLVSYDDDTFTYTLGVGRQLNETWAVAVSASHEPGTGGRKSNLSPTDGQTSLGLGVTYTQDEMKIQAGVRHIWLGDAVTKVGPAPGGNFTDNTALAFGLKIGFSF
jgi:long-subunit fatty acid transport protein